MIIEKIYKRNENRLDWIDILKAISMLCVMIGHYSFFPKSIADLYAPFFLSAFLFASGYSFHLEKNFVKFIKKRIKTLLWPWFWMGSLIVLSRFFLSFNEHDSILTEFQYFFIQIRGLGDECWFLICLFWSELLFYLIVINMKKEYKILLCSFLFCMISILYSTFYGVALPGHIQMWGTVSFFLSLGYVFKRKWEQKTFEFMNNKTLCISVLIYLMLLYVNVVILNAPAITFYTYGNNIILFFVLSIVGLFMIVNLAKSIKPSLLLLFIGENTLIFYGLHGKIESVFEKLLMGYISTNNIFLQFIFGIIGLIWIVLILTPMVWIIKERYPLLIGKNYRN